MTTTAELPMLIAEVRVARIERLSPTFIRTELAAPELEHFGVDGPLLDQRIKLVLPHEDGPVPSFAGADDSWYTTWLARPIQERGHMRTYTVRDVVGSGPDTRLVVDFVVHEDGLAGPGAGWALRAGVGDGLVVLAPRRGVPYGGIEFTPGDASSLLLVGDESAVPAVAGILRDLAADTRGRVFLEVPYPGDVQDLAMPEGVLITWLARGHAQVGEVLVPAVREYVGLPTLIAPEVTPEVDPDLWETPLWSSSGEDLDDHHVVGHDLDGLFAWIAGESSMVTRLRRALVKEVGIDRRQVAFMGYWRRGVAMQS